MIDIDRAPNSDALIASDHVPLQSDSLALYLPRGRRTGVSSAVGRRTNMCVVYINTLPRCLACDLFLLRLRVITPQEGLGIGKWDEGSRYVGQRIA